MVLAGGCSNATTACEAFGACLRLMSELQDAAQVALLREVLRLLRCHADSGDGAACQLHWCTAVEPAVRAFHVSTLLQSFSEPAAPMVHGAWCSSCKHLFSERYLALDD
jgi:hypothetical protein